jgi:uncharacterized membrane protein
MIRKGLLLSSIPLALMAALGAWAVSTVTPDARFPVHFGIDGQPDRWGSPAEAFFALFGVAVAVTAILAVVPLLDPRGANLRRSSGFYLTAWGATLWFLALLHGAMVASALGYLDLGSDMITRISGAGVSLLLLVIGNVMGKSRPNWFAGVRTPWTLSSDITWERTNRLGGRLFVLAGLVGAVAAWLLPTAFVLPAVVVGVAAAAVISIVYSWVVWRTAPDRKVGPQVLDH